MLALERGHVVGPQALHREHLFAQHGAPIGKALPDLHRAVETVGRDPRSIEVVLYHVVPDRKKLDYYATLAVTEVVFRLPNAPAAEVLPLLDEYEKLIH